MPGRPRVSSTTGTASRDRSVMIPMMQGLAITAQRRAGRAAVFRSRGTVFPGMWQAETSIGNALSTPTQATALRQARFELGGLLLTAATTLGGWQLLLLLWPTALGGLRWLLRLWPAALR